MRDALKNCPICNRPASLKSRYYPFCSERCRTQDLANWTTGTYSISQPLSELEEDFLQGTQPGKDSTDD